MYRKKFLSVASLFTALMIQHWVGVALNAQESMPSTPAAKLLSSLIDSVNRSDDSFLSEGFAKNDDATLSRRKMQTDQVRSQLGELSFKKVVSATDSRISALCETSSGANVVLTVSVTEEAPYKIKSVGVEMGSDDGVATDESALTEGDRTELIQSLAKELRSKYVYPKVGEKMAAALEASMAEEAYSDTTDVRELATELTDQLRAICSDKHLRVRSGSPRRPGASPGRRPIDNHGFVKAEMLPGGIGYLKFNYFSGDEAAQKTASAAMNFLGQSNALIFDLRENGGGSPKMIAYLSSYLFDEPVHLNSFYNRPTDTTTESWTQKEVPGNKFSPETRVFVLTSGNTFSGAEEFSYNLKNMKRGTIVGETTGGGAHPVMPVRLGERMHITMPFARAINPITETNWEGVGVEPDVAVAADQALEKAVELARANARNLAASSSVTSEKTETSSVDVRALAQEAAGLMQEESFQEAATKFKKLTKLAPDQGAAWFNYGYCLHASGELEKAIEIHKKAAGFERFAGIATYNLACAYSLTEQPDEAFDALKKAIKLGFGDADQINGDADFDNIRDDQRYAEIMKKLEDDN